MPELKRRLLEFLKECDKNPFLTVQQKKKLTDVPKGMAEQKAGRFLVQFRYKGIRYDKFFSQEPRSVALKLATEWMKNKRKELKQDNNEYISESDSDEEKIIEEPKPIIKKLIIESE